jgi:hypothetical protein
MDPGTLRSLRERLEAARRRGPRKFGDALRAEGTLALRALRTQGLSVKQAGEALSLSADTVRRWLAGSPRQSSPPASFTPVLVRPDAAPLTSPALISPSGFRVEGLSLEQLAQLLRGLQ